MASNVTLDLSGRVALITGGSRGIGAATVRVFVQAGASVLFNYQKAQGAAEVLVRECNASAAAVHGGEADAQPGNRPRCAAVQAELAGEGAAKSLIDATVARFGRLDALVINHGIWPSNDVPIDEMTHAQWQRTIDINLNSVFGLVKHGVAQMKRQNSGAASIGNQFGDQFGNRFGNQGGGHIVIISSTAGQRGEAFHCDYAASKGAVISMVKGLSTELARDGIYVNCVAPGWVATDMAATALADPATGAKIRNTIPLGRAGRPEEIAASILFLCTPHAGFITGEILNVNGGAVLVG